MNRHNRYNRRLFLQASTSAAILPSILPNIFSTSSEPIPLSIAKTSSSTLSITGIDLHVIKVNQRGNWYFIELKTNKGISGLGECSHAFSGLSKEGDAQVRGQVAAFFELVKGESPFNIEQYRQRAWGKATSKLTRTVLSGIEQSLWDICGKALEVPVYNMLGGKVRDKVGVYANINRTTNEKDANGRRPVEAFQKNAETALKEGFSAIKMAPFDEMKPLATSSATQIEEDIAHGIRCIEGVRSTVGEGVSLLIDVHSHLNTELAIQTAKRLEKTNLYWYEEPVDPYKYLEDTKTIHEAIQQPFAGGEAIFGREGFASLIQNKALDIIMPDVKHCGGILECKYIAAAAQAAGGIQVAPHNPSGPIATAASVQVCAGLSNFAILEMAYGEVPWSKDLVIPGEQFHKGYIPVSNEPGLGYKLNYPLIKAHA